MNLKNKILKIISALSFVGVMVSLYSLYGHYFGSANSFCNINDTFSCLSAYQSEYSEIFRIPVALFGIVGYGLLYTIASWGLSGKIASAYKPILTLSFLAVLFSGRLAYASAVVIQAWCPACMVSYAMIVSIFILAVLLRREESGNR